MADRGQILEKYIRKEKVNVTTLSGKLPWTTKTIYRHFVDPKLPLEKMLMYAKALRYDFADELPELGALKNVLKEAEPGYKTKIDIESAGNYYRDKYEDLLEQHNKLLAKYSALLEERLVK